MHKNAKDLTGETIGKLTVLYENGRTKDGHIIWHCRCSCDKHTELDVSSHDLGKDTKSCGCLVKEVLIERNFKHGDAKTRFHRIWLAMKNRCNNPKGASYFNYGGRGIKVCEEWNEYINFKEDMYESYCKHVEEFGEKNTTLDRIDVNGNYEPSNCRWATLKEQANNVRCKTVTYKGETHKVSEWANILGIRQDVIFERLNRGLPVDDVLYSGNLRTRKYDITYNGETHSLSEWSKITGVSKVNIRNRFNRGLALEDVFYNGNLRHKELK